MSYRNRTYRPEFVTLTKEITALNENDIQFFTPGQPHKIRGIRDHEYRVFQDLSRVISTKLLCIPDKEETPSRECLKKYPISKTSESQNLSRQLLSQDVILN